MQHQTHNNIVGSKIITFYIMKNTREKNAIELYRDDIMNAMNALVLHYIYPDVAKRIKKAVVDWLDSDIGKMRLKNGDVVTIAWELNAICVSLAHDQHLSIKSNNIKYGATDYEYYGLGMTSPHFIEILFIDDINVDEVRSYWIKVLSQIKDYVVLDLRNCRGGYQQTMQFILSFFFKTGVDLFHTSEKTDNLLFKSLSKLSFYQTHNQIKKFNGKVYVCISGSTFSAGEIIAKVFQSKKRAKLYGTHTAGSQYGSLMETFGFIDIMIPFATVIVDGFTMREGIPVEPDYHISSPKCVDFIHKILTPSLTESHKVKDLQ